MSTDTDNVKTAHQYQLSAAGAEGNVAVAATRLGLDVYFQTKLGRDFLGDNVIAQFNSEKVATEHFIRTENYTGTLVRNRGQEEQLDVTYLRRCSAASTFEPTDIDLKVLAQSRWLHVSGITVALSDSAHETVAYAISKAREFKVPISLDLNIRRKLWSNAKASISLRELAHDIELLTGGVDEYQLVFGSEDPEENLKLAAAKNIKTLIMTAGPDQMRILHHGERIDYQPEEIKVVDPVGSGDAFIGGTISGILGGLDLMGAVAQGSRCGAIVASTLGDWAGMVNGVRGVADE